MTAWVAYNALQHGGCCEICRQPAAFALVRLSSGIALSMLRIVCAQHAPATATKADDPDDPYRHFPKRPVVER